MTLADRIPWLASALKTKRWLVGVSGGADSVALLHLLVEAGFSDLVVCHLHHGLRGRAATEDAKFVGRLSQGLGLKCEVGRADVRGRMASARESLETAARHARHEFFGDCARKFRCGQLLLAHHADDQAETILWNLLRGSHGLKGMQLTKSIAAIELIRPLLGVRHDELVEYLNAKGLRWREDSSNAEPAAIRNRLRHEGLPLLAEITGRDPVTALVRGAAEAQELRDLEAWALERSQVRDPQGRLHVPALRKLPVVLQRAALWEFLRDHDIGSLDRALVDRGLSLLDPRNSAAVNLPGGGRLRRREGRLWIEN